MTRIKKTLKSLFACLLLISILGTAASAATYNFHFIPPFAGSARWATATIVSGSTPYVQPSGTTNATTYVLVLPTYHSTTTVSSFQTNVTSGKKTFTYNTGYGGAGLRFNLLGHPTNSDFQEYYAAGSWSP